MRNKQPERLKIKESDTSHPIRLYWDRLPALGSRQRKRVPTVVKPNVEGPPTIHILLELRCIAHLVFEVNNTRGRWTYRWPSRLQRPAQTAPHLLPWNASHQTISQPVRPGRSSQTAQQGLHSPSTKATKKTDPSLRVYSEARTGLTLRTMI